MGTKENKGKVTVLNFGYKKSRQAGFFINKVIKPYFLNFLPRPRPKRPRPKKAKLPGAGTR